MEPSLYMKYGGFGQIHQIVEAFYDRILESETLGPYFENTNFHVLIDHQVNFISSIMGGPQCFDDSQLSKAHAHLSITNDAWDEVIDTLQAVLNHFGMEKEDIEHLIHVITEKKNMIIN
ncbi:truncated hemoglobin [uncultured Vibrio sp.]|mgnify:FL=1|uniref:truncated hemoglobin n=1 Tax=uncultured Vibrio sp. TaxID=114054 RepID=UPI0025EA9CF7|nr:group 1 truncated hemoglobin [uncultured Vibrio sp.]